jgi:pyruvate/2-oxoglutarate dehydrogenase complex dihydrolipoamide acyltransferase (E2) component
MNKLVSRTIQLSLVTLLASVLLVPQGVFAAQAPNHIVSSADLQRDVASSSAARQQNIKQVESFLAMPGARQALQSAHIDYQQVKNAVPQLNNQELARLAKISQNAQKQFAAGSLSDRDLLWILIGVGVIILIVVAA